MENNVNYWNQQLQAYIRDFTEYTKVPTSDFNREVVLLETTEMDREERAMLINDLERSGFTVTSGTSEETIVIEADSSRLEVNYA